MGIYNGCGGEGGISFGKIVRHNLELFPKYQKEKGFTFWQDIEVQVCMPHDMDFYLGGGLYAYLKSNLIFTYRFCKKLWWTNILIQLLSFPIVFIGLSLGGMKYFNWHLFGYGDNNKKLG